MEWTTVIQNVFYGGLAVEAALIVSLLFRKNNGTANRLLVVHLLSVFHIQIVNYLNYTGRIEQVPYLVRTPLPAALISIWSLYEYLCALIVPGYHLDRRSLFRFFPALGGIIWCVATTLQQVPNARVLTPDFFQQRVIHLFILLCIFSFYYAAAFRRLQNFRKTLPLFFSNFTKVRLQWLNVLFGCSVALWGVALTDLLMGVDVALWYIMIPAITLESMLLAIFTLRQSPIFFEGDGTQEVAKISVERKKQAREEYFSSDELSQQTRRLKELLQREKPFLNPELRLNELAQMLDLKPYQLTEVINRGEGKNFYELVNSHRIEEFKRRAKDPAFSHLSLLGLAMDSGFNSKSVFNETFRKMTGQTPSEFRSGSTPESTQ